MQETIESTQPAHQQTRHRAVFSQEDFSLLKAAVALYAKDMPAGTDAIKYANLYHRLSRIA